MIGIFIIIAIVAVVAGTAVYSLRSQPTCSDGLQNGDEEGVDCGGKCSVMCLVGEPTPPVVLWSRFFNVRQGIFDAGALVENINVEARATILEYVFRLYDSAGVLLAEEAGQTFLEAGEQAFLYKPGLVTGIRSPSRVEFIVSRIEWIRDVPDEDPLDIILVSRAFELDNGRRMRVTLRNRSLFPEDHIGLSILLKDASGTVYAASQTRLEDFAPGSERDAVFTWPTATFAAPSSVEVLFRRIPR